MYSNYEEYMQKVLGYNLPNTYTDYYSGVRNTQNLQEVNRFYPEIYGIVYPVVQKVCSRKANQNLSEEQVNKMVEEVYHIIEPGDDIVENNQTLKNGDVRNPRVKETRRSQNNYLLRDLIRILIIRELLSGGGPVFIPGMPGQNVNSGMGPIPPIMRPRISKWNVLII